MQFATHHRKAALSPGLILACLLTVCSLQAQPVRVGTEFVRYTPAGEIFPQDNSATPMEVLSPPLVRGVWNSFRLIVDVDPGDSYRLYVAQNPENAMQVRLFREVLSQGTAGWEIERREPAPLPFRSSAIPIAERPSTRSNYTFWLDVRPPVDYPSRRLKLEAQIFVSGEWFIYPMEIRVMDLDLPNLPPGQAELPTGTLGIRTADAPYRDVVRQFVCGSQTERTRSAAVPEGADASLETHSARAFDFILDALATEAGREDVLRATAGFLGYRQQSDWCQAPSFPTAAYGVEWPAAMRNRLLRVLGNPD